MSQRWKIQSAKVLLTVMPPPDTTTDLTMFDALVDEASSNIVIQEFDKGLKQRSRVVTLR